MSRVWDIIIINKADDDTRQYDNYFRSLKLNVIPLDSTKIVDYLDDVVDLNAQFRVWVHLDAGYKQRPYPGEPIAELLKKYSDKLEFQFITRQNLRGMEDINGIKVYALHLLKRNELNKFPVNTKAALKKTKKQGVSRAQTVDAQSGCNDCIADIAIVTATYDDEFENLRKEFGLEKDTSSSTATKILYRGELISRSGSKIKIISGYLAETGIVDAGILAAELIIRFTPKYVAMTGVCGGNPEKEKIKMGDVVVANKLFLYQKGKLTEKGMETEIATCEIDTTILQHIQENKKDICLSVEKDDPSRASQYQSNRLNVHIEPMACGTIVLNKPAGFKELITPQDRKAIAVDMESYSIARACKTVGSGNSKAIIVKSIMDRTQNKTDADRSFAAATSAKFLKYLAKDILPF